MRARSGVLFRVAWCFRVVQEVCIRTLTPIFGNATVRGGRCRRQRVNDAPCSREGGRRHCIKGPKVRRTPCSAVPRSSCDDWDSRGPLIRHAALPTLLIRSTMTEMDAAKVIKENLTKAHPTSVWQVRRLLRLRGERMTHHISLLCGQKRFETSL